MRGQLYKIPCQKMDAKHDPSGDCVFKGDDDVCGFVVRRCDDGRLLIVLFKSQRLHKNAEVILEYCDAVSILREEADRNPVLKTKLEKVKSLYDGID